MLIQQFIPKPLHRLVLKIAHKVRHRWRLLRKVHLRGVSVIALDHSGRVLLVRHSYGPDGWALPGGGMGSGEEPQAAARRELSEEVGCECSTMRLLDTTEETISGSPHTAYLFEGELVGEPKPDGREIIQARMFSPDALPSPLIRSTKNRLTHWLESSR